MNQARTYNDQQLDTLSRSVFYATAKYALDVLSASHVDDEKLVACAAAMEAASSGFDDADEEHNVDVPAGMRQATPFNDDLLNEIGRELYMKALLAVQALILGTQTMNTEKLHALARIADAAACAFQPDEDDDD